MNRNEQICLAVLTLFLIALPVVVGITKYSSRPTNPLLGSVAAYLRPATVGLGYHDIHSERFHSRRTGVVIASDTRSSPVYYILTVPFEQEGLHVDVNLAVDRSPLTEFVTSGDVVAKDTSLCLVRVTKTPYALPLAPCSWYPDTAQYFGVAIVDERHRAVAGVPLNDLSTHQQSFRSTTLPLHDSQASSLGAPLVDKDGYLLGIYAGHTRDVHHYIGLEQIREFLARHAVTDFLWQPATTVLATTRSRQAVREPSPFRLLRKHSTDQEY